MSYLNENDLTEFNPPAVAGIPSGTAPDPEFGAQVREQDEELIHRAMSKIAPGREYEIVGGYWPYGNAAEGSPAEQGRLGDFRIRFTDRGHRGPKNILLHVRPHGDARHLKIGSFLAGQLQKFCVQMSSLFHGKEAPASYTEGAAATSKFVFATNYIREPGPDSHRGVTAHDLGKLAARMRAASLHTKEILSNPGSEDLRTLHTDWKDITQKTTMALWERGRKISEEQAQNNTFDRASAPYSDKQKDMLSSILERTQKFLFSADAPRAAPSHFNPIPRHVHLHDGGQLFLTSLSTAARGYVPPMAPNVSYDTAVMCYRWLDEAQNVPEKRRSTEFCIGRIHAFVDAYNHEAGKQKNLLKIAPHDLISAMQKANALDTALAFALLEGIKDKNQSLEDVVKAHLGRKERHFDLLNRVEHIYYNPETILGNGKKGIDVTLANERRGAAGKDLLPSGLESGPR